MFPGESYEQVESRLFDAPATNQAWQMLYWITALNFAGTFPGMQSEGTLKICRKKLESEIKDFPLDWDEANRQKWNDVPSEISSM